MTRTPYEYPNPPIKREIQPSSEYESYPIPFAIRLIRTDSSQNGHANAMDFSFGNGRYRSLRYPCSL